MKANEEQREAFTTKTTAFGLRLFAIRNKNIVVVKLRPVELKENETISEDDFTIEVYNNNPPLIGMARCHMNDKFDFRKGVGLATLRLLEQHWRNQKRRCEIKLWAVTNEKERRLREIGVTPGFVKVLPAVETPFVEEIKVEVIPRIDTLPPPPMGGHYVDDNNHPITDARLPNQERPDVPPTTTTDWHKEAETNQKDWHKEAEEEKNKRLKDYLEDEDGIGGNL